MSGLERIAGVRLKIRTWEDEDGHRMAVAHASIDGKLGPELGSVSLDLCAVESPSDPLYQSWADLMGRFFAQWLKRTTGETLVTKRAKPDYRGEKDR